MKVDVYDTYATAPDGTLLHFDVLVPSGTQANRATEYALQFVGGIDPEIEVEKCEYCHWEDPPVEVLQSILEQGYHILPLGNCPKPTSI